MKADAILLVFVIVTAGATVFGTVIWRIKERKKRTKVANYRDDGSEHRNI